MDLCPTIGFDDSCNNSEICEPEQAEAATCDSESGATELCADSEAASAACAAPAQLLNSDERATMIIEHRECGRKLASRLLREWRIQLGKDELDGAADLAVCEAAERFDSSRGTRFSTFLYYYIRGNLLRMIERTVAEKRAVQAVQYLVSASRNEQFDLADAPDINPIVDPDACLTPQPVSPEESYLQQERVGVVTQACEQLTGVEREVIMRRFMKGESPSEIASALGYTRREVMFFERSAFNVLKPILVAAGLGPADKPKEDPHAASGSAHKALSQSAIRRARRLQLLHLRKPGAVAIAPTHLRPTAMERRLRRVG